MQINERKKNFFRNPTKLNLRKILTLNKFYPIVFRSFCLMECFEKYRKPDTLKHLEKRITCDHSQIGFKTIVKWKQDSYILLVKKYV